jgi:UDP-N-acetylmuramate-alanine ligase
MIIDSAIAQGHADACYVEDKQALPDFLAGRLRPGDRVVLFGAGDINRQTPRIMEKMEK